MTDHKLIISTERAWKGALLQQAGGIRAVRPNGPFPACAARNLTICEELVDTLASTRLSEGSTRASLKQKVVQRGCWSRSPYNPAAKCCDHEKVLLVMVGKRKRGHYQRLVGGGARSRGGRTPILRKRPQSRRLAILRRSDGHQRSSDEL